MLLVERDPRVTRILAKLGEVGRLADLAAPIQPAEVAEFEAQHGIALPAAYKTFLLDGGAHGPGPYGGLLPLSSWADARVIDASNVGDRSALRRNLSRAAYQRLRVGTRDWLAEPLLGTIAVAHGRGNDYIVLVVAGPDAGALAFVDLDAGVPEFCDDADFLAWYERWLDELRGGYDVAWFGRGMAGTEASFAAHLVAGTRTVDALAGLARVPALDEPTRALVVRFAADPDRDVRAAAWRAVVRHRLDVAPRWDDPDPEVRRLALDAARACELPWREHARRALADGDAEVARHALAALAGDASSELPVDDVLPLLAGPLTDDAALALAKQPSTRALPALLAAGRIEAVIAHVRAGVASPDQLADALGLASTHPRLLAAIVNTGVAPHDAAALVNLLACARDDDPAVRYEAAGALGDVALDEAVTALVALTDDTTTPPSHAWSIGQYARRSLAKLRGTLGRA